MTFTPEALDFLVENQFHDSRSWYHEHKHIYKEKVVQPMVELIDALAPTFENIDPRIQCDPRRISRLYRDARRCRGKSTFRDSVWCTFLPGNDRENPLPAFYFEISPRGFDFGCGYYMMPTPVRDAMREIILENDPLFREALEAYEGQKVFSIYGEMYKRDHYPEQEPRVSNWLNRKGVGMSAASTDFELLFSDRLIGYLAEKYMTLKHFWKLLIAAEERWRERQF